MDAPAGREREEEPLRDDLRESVWNGLLSLLLDGHARGEGADFEGIGARKLVCGGEGHGLQHQVFEGLGDAVQWGRRGFLFERKYFVEFFGQFLGRERFFRYDVPPSNGCVFFLEAG